MASVAHSKSICPNNEHVLSCVVADCEKVRLHRIMSKRKYDFPCNGNNV